MEDEKYFSTLAFMKSKLRNKLTTHFPIVVCMFAQQSYTLVPYAKCIGQWRATQHHYYFDG
jgi:hypothetical protein